MKKNNKMAKNLVLYTLIIAGLIVCLVVFSQMKQETTGAEHVTFEEPPAIAGQPLLGDAHAKVTIVEFGDYKCPSCKAWHETVFPQLEEAYIQTGQANFAFINTLFHGEESQLAALAAESVWAQDKQAFWIFHHELFERQPQHSHNARWVTSEVLMEIAEEHTPDLNIDLLKEDLQQQRYLAQVEEDMHLVEKYTIKLTPSIMINEILIEDPFDYEAIVTVIEDQLKE